jgi:hypothetical protein
MSKYIKLNEIVVMQVFGSTKGERCFNTLSFYKRQSQEMVDYSFGCCHLNVCSKVYILENFYYD